MNGPTPKAQPSPSQFVVTRTGNKDLRFKGVLLGQGDVFDDRQHEQRTTRVRLFRTQSLGYIWAWDRHWGQPLDAGTEIASESLERADATVIEADSDTRLLAHRVWINRPDENARLTEASARAWNLAAGVDPVIGAAQYEEVE